MQPVTLWFRFNPPQGVFEYNHLEDGHAASKKPTPKHPAHEGWGRATWESSMAWITDSSPPKIVHYGPEDIGEQSR